MPMTAVTDLRGVSRQLSSQHSPMAVSVRSRRQMSGCASSGKSPYPHEKRGSSRLSQPFCKSSHTSSQ